MRVAKGVASDVEKRHPVEEQTQRGHFYGFGDPDHVPSILQNITAQRYLGSWVLVLWFVIIALVVLRVCSGVELYYNTSIAGRFFRKQWK